MSFALHPMRKRQSCQATKTFPAPSISADGSGLDRMLPGSSNAVIAVITITWPKLAPPFVETTDSSFVSVASSIGTITFPLGWTRGCPPVTLAAGTVAAVHVRPPSRE